MDVVAIMVSCKFNEGADSTRSNHNSVYDCFCASSMWQTKKEVEKEASMRVLVTRLLRFPGA